MEISKMLFTSTHMFTSHFLTPCSSHYVTNYSEMCFSCKVVLMIKQIPYNQIVTDCKSNHDTIAEPRLGHMIKKVFYKMYIMMIL